MAMINLFEKTFSEALDIAIKRAEDALSQMGTGEPEGYCYHPREVMEGYVKGLRFAKQMLHECKHDLTVMEVKNVCIKQCGDCYVKFGKKPVICPLFSANIGIDGERHDKCMMWATQPRNWHIPSIERVVRDVLSEEVEDD